MKDDMLVFEVRLGIIVQKGTTLRILDENGNELFSERIGKTSFVKHYKFGKYTFSKLQFNVKGRPGLSGVKFLTNHPVAKQVKLPPVSGSNNIIAKSNLQGLVNE